MPFVTVPKEFFRQERRNIYGDWRAAFWRELFQNSIDAGATRVEIGLVEKQNNEVVVLFSDNGCGMTRDVIENVYFRLGESTKGGDSIGGFGRARIVTCFSMVSYEIWTQDNHVVGEGAHYEVHNHTWKPGCHLRIVVDDQKESPLRYALDDFLRESDIPATVLVDGNPTKVIPEDRGRYVRHLEVNGKRYAEVFVNDESAKNKNKMLVRVRGVLMHSRYVRVKKQITVEINPQFSREVLTASRDSLMEEFSADLNRFTDQLAVDVESALKARRAHLSTVVRGRTQFRTKERCTTGDSKSAMVGAASVHHGYVERVGRLLDVSEEVSDSPDQDYDIHVVQDTEEAALIRAIPRFVPTNWVEKLANGRFYQKGSTAKKLLTMWTIACESAIDAYLESRKYAASVSFSIGWIFDESLQARCDRKGDGYVFLLNPVDENGKLRYKISQRSDLKRLMAVAKHEIAHMVESYHDETYARALTEIDANFDEAATFRRMRSAR